MSDAKKHGPNRKTAEAIYDLLMGEIEPDLLLYSIPNLDVKYEGETEAEHKERMKRYKKAYKEFDKKLAEFMGNVKHESRQAKKTAMHKKEQQDRAGEQEDLLSLEAAFS